MCGEPSGGTRKQIPVAQTPLSLFIRSETAFFQALCSQALLSSAGFNTPYATRWSGRGAISWQLRYFGQEIKCLLNSLDCSGVLSNKRERKFRVRFVMQRLYWLKSKDFAASARE